MPLDGDAAPKDVDWPSQFCGTSKLDKSVLSHLLQVFDKDAKWARSQDRAHKNSVTILKAVYEPLTATLGA